MSNKDLSSEAIKKRYDKANMMSIVTSSRIVFESLMDIPSLLKERKIVAAHIQKLERRVEELESKNETPKTE